MEVFLGVWQAVAVFDLFLAMLFCKFHAKRKVGKKAFFSLFSAFSPSLKSVLLAGHHERGPESRKKLAHLRGTSKCAEAAKIKEGNLPSRQKVYFLAKGKIGRMLAGQSEEAEL